MYTSTKVQELACARLLTWGTAPRESHIVTLSEHHWLVPGRVTQAGNDEMSHLTFCLGAKLSHQYSALFSLTVLGVVLDTESQQSHQHADVFSELLKDISCLLIPVAMIHSCLSLMLPSVLLLLNPVSGRGPTTLGWTRSRPKGDWRQASQNACLATCSALLLPVCFGCPLLSGLQWVYEPWHGTPWHCWQVSCNASHATHMNWQLGQGFAPF